MDKSEEKINKQEFLNDVYNTIFIHPDWTTDLILAAQTGLINLLEKEQTEKADLAYAFSAFINEKPKLKSETKESIQRGLLVLEKFFKTAPIEHAIHDYIIL